MSGFAFWSHDIGGFETTAPADVYKRWLAFGLLSSHSRLHGSTSYRVPWAFDEEACDVARHFVHLKCRLMPYLYAKAVEAHKEGTPILRPMVFEFPDDPACGSLDMQYMLGESILAAPIFNEEGKAWYYLPEGSWVNYFDGTCKEGGRFYEGTYDYFSLPFYIKENTLLALGTVWERPDYDYAGNSELHFYAPVEGKEAVCNIPDTEGNIVATITVIYRNGRLESHVEGTCGEVFAGRKVTVHDRDGKSTEMSL